LNAFITGSRVYGTPTEDSDIDLVVLVDNTTKRTLQSLNQAVSEPNLIVKPVRFGNLILCDTEDAFDCWKKSLVDCIRASDDLNRPLTRDEAVRIHVKNEVDAFGDYGSPLDHFFADVEF
jgi:hypothetical protein